MGGVIFWHKLFLYITIIVSILAALTFVFRTKAFSPRLKYFGFFVLVGALIELLAFVLARMEIPNLILSHIYTPLEFLFIGLFVGIMYTQRTIALLYPIVIFFYMIFLNQNLKEKLFKFFSLTMGMSLILILIGFYNYNRAGIFYFTPIQSKSDIQTYLEGHGLFRYHFLYSKTGRLEDGTFHL